jgi:hypothetical protein
VYTLASVIHAPCVLVVFPMCCVLFGGWKMGVGGFPFRLTGMLILGDWLGRDNDMLAPFRLDNWMRYASFPGPSCRYAKRLPQNGPLTFIHLTARSSRRNIASQPYANTARDCELRIPALLSCRVVRTNRCPSHLRLYLGQTAS